MKIMKQILCILRGEKMPVWLTILLTVIAGFCGAIGTLYLAPSINAKFEVQKAHSLYVMENLKLFNSETAGIFSVVSDITQDIEESKKDRDTNVYKFRELILKLQWRLTEYETLFKDKRSVKAITDYNEALKQLSMCVGNAHSMNDISSIQEKVKNLAIQSRNIIILLSQKTEWSYSFSVV